MKEKICTKCNKIKPISLFRKRTDKKNSYTSWCKPCKAADILDRRRRQSCGVDATGYQIMLENQEYVCAICGVHVDDCTRSLAVDHNHETGFARGLLCGGCNRGLGYFKDNIDFLRDAAEYLEEHS